jgi:hypothetical protein
MELPSYDGVFFKFPITSAPYWKCWTIGLSKISLPLDAVYNLASRHFILLNCMGQNVLTYFKK